MPDVYVRFFLGVVKGDKGSREGPAPAPAPAAVVRGEVLLDLEGLLEEDTSPAWESRRRARIKADLKWAGLTEEAF